MFSSERRIRCNQSIPNYMVITIAAFAIIFLIPSAIAANNVPQLLASERKAIAANNVPQLLASERKNLQKRFYRTAKVNGSQSIAIKLARIAVAQASGSQRSPNIKSHPWGKNRQSQLPKSYPATANLGNTLERLRPRVIPYRRVDSWHKPHPRTHFTDDNPVHLHSINLGASVLPKLPRRNIDNKSSKQIKRSREPMVPKALLSMAKGSGMTMQLPTTKPSQKSLASPRGHIGGEINYRDTSKYEHLAEPHHEKKTEKYYDDTKYRNIESKQRWLTPWEN